jgi:hypothetical protein
MSFYAVNTVLYLNAGAVETLVSGTMLVIYGYDLALSAQPVFLLCKPASALLANFLDSFV